MSFISYAQNFEDVMLWRALHRIENGFYIDVGANDPTLYSVTKAFYDRGWHGINVEPVTQFIERLQAERPRDINLQVGAGATDGNFPFYDIPDSGLATSDPAVAEMHRKEGWDVRTIHIPVLRLADICEKHATGEIHFLKVDVEGAEKNVLLGMDFQKWRPWIVVVEATIPMSRQTAHQDWEPILLNAQYEFVYFDGLNRYYVANEHSHLKPDFASPPNVFDGFVLNTDQESRARADEAEARAIQSRKQTLDAEAKRSEAEARMHAAEARTKEAEAKAHAAHEEALLAEHRLHEATLASQERDVLIGALLSSTSWKITAPLRWLGASAPFIKRSISSTTSTSRSVAVRLARAGVRHAVPVIRRSPFLTRCAKQLRNAFPSTADRLFVSAKAVTLEATIQKAMSERTEQNDLPAWGETATPADFFEIRLRHELKQRQDSKGA